MEQKKRLLIDSANYLFYKYGVKKTSIDEIIRHAGVAKGTFYLYFNNKEDIYKNIIDRDIEHAKKFMHELYDNFPSIKERLVNYLVGSIFYFKKNNIIRNMVLGNETYFIGDVTISYLEDKHISMLGILLQDFDYNDDYKFEFLIKLIGNFKQILLLENKCFKTEDDFYDFMLDYARVLVNGFFSNYENLGKGIDLNIIKKTI